MGDTAAMLDAFLMVEDEAAKPLQAAIWKAIIEDMDIARALGVRGSLKISYYRSRRDAALQTGARAFDSVGAFVEEFEAWKAQGRPAWHPGLVALFEDLEEASSMGVELPGSDSQLRKIAGCG